MLPVYFSSQFRFICVNKEPTDQGKMEFAIKKPLEGLNSRNQIHAIIFIHFTFVYFDEKLFFRFFNLEFLNLVEFLLILGFCMLFFIHLNS